ncbi:hypothetical protein [uncultured Clostridium sp.]|uniref:hypothetical protein n=1 Tax=uncultured Clostridium sp. TaxID=59620 RepID=UPI00263918AF|nr:hypothetical protein [uncultured Clostridium sp.]
MMHREVVSKRKAPVIAISLIIITFMLYIHEGLKLIKFKDSTTLQIWNIIIMTITILILLGEIISCYTSYKYSIIADKLIVNKILGHNERNLASIRLSNIRYIGAKSAAPKTKCKSVGSFVCSLFNQKACICIFEKEGKVYKFEFEPSEEFIHRVNRAMV